jgi:hypothetical protein
VCVPVIEEFTVIRSPPPMALWIAQCRLPNAAHNHCAVDQKHAGPGTREDGGWMRFSSKLRPPEVVWQ